MMFGYLKKITIDCVCRIKQGKRSERVVLSNMVKVLSKFKILLNGEEM